MFNDCATSCIIQVWRILRESLGMLCDYMKLYGLLKLEDLEQRL
jgi:hypothetical protein